MCGFQLQAFVSGNNVPVVKLKLGQCGAMIPTCELASEATCAAARGDVGQRASMPESTRRTKRCVCWQVLGILPWHPSSQCWLCCGRGGHKLQEHHWVVVVQSHLAASSVSRASVPEKILKGSEKIAALSCVGQRKATIFLNTAHILGTAALTLT